MELIKMRISKVLDSLPPSSLKSTSLKQKGQGSISLTPQALAIAEVSRKIRKISRTSWPF